MAQYALGEVVRFRRRARTLQGVVVGQRLTATDAWIYEVAVGTKAVGRRQPVYRIYEEDIIGAYLPHRNGTPSDPYRILTIGDRLYTVCGHPIGDLGYCGHLIDVTDLPVTICCGRHECTMPWI